MKTKFGRRLRYGLLGRRNKKRVRNIAAEAMRSCAGVKQRAFEVAEQDIREEFKAGSIITSILISIAVKIAIELAKALIEYWFSKNMLQPPLGEFAMGEPGYDE